MKYTDFTISKDDFTGHLVEPEGGSDRAVIVISGGEKSLLPGSKIAERFADYGITGLAVSLFGAEGLPVGADRIPVDMFEPAVNYLRETRGISHISAYGMSMGSIFAVLAARYIKGIENVILVSPTHAPFEGSVDKKHMSGHSVATYRGEEIPFVKLPLDKYKAGKYYGDRTGMWHSYRDAYADKATEEAAYLRVEELSARVLLIAGDADEMWPSDYSVKYMAERMERAGKEYKSVIYPSAGHLVGMMPSREKNKWLYRGIPLIGLMYRSFRDNREACMAALAASEREIVAFVRRSI